MVRDLLIWGVALASVAGIVVRPRHWPEAVWAVAGAVVLVAAGLVGVGDAWRAIEKGQDVYFFLIGMMLLSEVARQEGLFDYLAAIAARLSGGSSLRLFTLIYGVGTLVTVFLSNDATAVVLTPAVYAATRTAKVAPAPYLFACAFIANAASFVLPISNPANLVVFASHPPALVKWLGLFAPAAAVSIVLTFVALRVVFAGDLRQTIQKSATAPALPSGGRIAAWGIVAATLVVVCASALGVPLGLPTLVAGAGTAGLVLLGARKGPWDMVRGVSWSVLPLVAGLFVIVAGLEQTGAVDLLTRELGRAVAGLGTGLAGAAAGLAVALAANLTNNLPAGLMVASLVAQAEPSQMVTASLLVGVDLGPNLSVTGSLATILWLLALRREGFRIGGWHFQRVGFVVMTPALAGALAVLAAGHA